VLAPISRRIRAGVSLGALALGLVGPVLLLGGCTAERAGGRVLVLGLDGMDPGTIDLMIAEGKLPNFERLRREGAHAPLESRLPLMSPVIWTTVATGMTPDVHGIGAFVAVNDKTGERMPVTSQMRQVKALWNLATEADLTSAVVGWWATWPAETVRGSIVSDHLCYHFLFEKALDEKSGSLGLTHPDVLQEELQSQVLRPDDLSYEEARRFVDVNPDEFDRPFDYHDDLSHFRWALATAKTYAGIGLDLWREDRPELAMVYIEGVDSTSHLFGNLFRADGLQGELAEQQRRYGRTVEEMYHFADDLVGEYMAVMDAETTLVILSDHGFRLGELLADPSKIEDLRRVRTDQHSLHGILYMAGRHVRPGAGLADPSILDIAPTILALLGLPASEDMPGRVLTEGLTLEPPARVQTYEMGGPGASSLARDSRVDPQILARLDSLGYLDASAPRSERVLAGAMFGEGKLEEALAHYRMLLQEQPDSPGLHVSIAGTLGDLGRYDEAEEHLARALEIDPLSSPAYHNRGVIAERRGDKERAIHDYRTALRYKPDYLPSREALIRLVGTAEPPPPATEAGREADRLAAQAAEAAKRGSFDTAMSLLDEAQALAPDHAILYQYRSNVAYFMGDREAAIRALEKGLELEPDNALFSENLRTLNEQAATESRD
jgi:tetratricopeptide (TPR) repeat protein